MPLKARINLKQLLWEVFSASIKVFQCEPLVVLTEQCLMLIIITVMPSNCTEYVLFSWRCFRGPASEFLVECLPFDCPVAVE